MIFAITENQVLSKQKLFLSTCLLEGRYPDTDRLINDQFNTAITVVASDLVAAVDRAWSSHTDKIILRHYQLMKSYFINRYFQKSEKLKKKIMVENYEGASLDVSFNPDYLKDALRLFGSSEATTNF